MKVLVPGLSGFCPGLKSAENRILDIKGKYPEKQIHFVGYMINNRKYIKYLKTLQIFTVDSCIEVPEGSLMAIRTHGINRLEEEKMREKFEVIDLTCRNVKKVQLTIEQYSRQNYTVLITGKKNHPEIKGLISFARKSYVIETEEDLKNLLQNPYILFSSLKKENKLLIISQTTGNHAYFQNALEKIKEKFANDVTIKCIDSICPVTKKKEEQALKLQKKSDISFVIGDTISSNANKLFDRLSAAGSNVHFIEDLDALKSLSLPLNKSKCALVVSSASTPLFIENEVCEHLRGII